MLPPTLRYRDLPFAHRLTLRRPGLLHFLSIGTRARRSRHPRFAHMLHPIRNFRIRNFVPDDESEFCAPRNSETARVHPDFQKGSAIFSRGALRYASMLIRCPPDLI